MQIQIGQKASVLLYLFSGTVAYNRPAPLYKSVLLAVSEKPGITREELCDLLAIPMPWISRLCEPLLKSGLLVEDNQRLLLTPTGAQNRPELPVEQREGDFLALVLEEPIDGKVLLACVSAADLRIGSERRDDMEHVPGLRGLCFDATGTIQYEINTREGKKIAPHELRGGSLHEVLNGCVLELGHIEGLIITAEGKSALGVFKKIVPHDRDVIHIDCNLPITLYHTNAEELARESILRHNQEKHLPAQSRNTKAIRKTFASLDEAEKRNAKGSLTTVFSDTLVCILHEVPIYPRTKMDFELWAAWRIRQLIDRHLTDEAYEQIVAKESSVLPGHSEFGQAAPDKVRQQLTPKQKMYLVAARDWPLPQS